MNYSFYNFLYGHLIKMLSKNSAEVKKLLKRAKNDEEQILLLKHLYPFLKTYFERDRLSHFAILDEIRWVTSKERTAIFAPSSDFLDLMINTKADKVRDITLIKPPSKSFVLSVPSDFKIEGHKISGLLINYFESYEEHRAETIKLQRFFDEQGGGAPLMHTPDSGDSPILSITYKIDNEVEVQRFLAPISLYKEIIHSGSLESSEFVKLSSFDLSAEESKVQLTLVKMLLVLFVYIKSFSGEALINGLPEGLKLKSLNSRHALKAYPSFISTNNDFVRLSYKGEVTGHFRTLEHEKYYQGQYKNDERGSRVIYIPPYTKGDISAKTINDGSERE